MNVSNKKDPKQKFSLVARGRSFKNAVSGFVTLLRFEHNARVHLIVLLIVILAALFLRISAIDWISILFASGLVLISECFNTAIEYLCDVVTQNQNETIKRAKDVAAAGVLISAIISVIIGMFVFLPYLYRFFAG
jgi:diacylglycerol kinase